MLEVKREDVPVIIIHTGLLLLKPVNISCFQIESWPQGEYKAREEAVVVKEIIDNIFPNIHQQFITDLKFYYYNLIGFNERKNKL